MIGIGAGAVGSIASAIGKKDPKFDSTGINSVTMDQQGYMGAQGEQAASGSLAAMQGFRGDAAFGAQTDLASLLKQYQQDGAMPTAQDSSRAQSFAQSQFDPQRVAMQQAFQDQLTQANRQAALSGRGVNDPILRAKLAQEQTRQGAMLQSQQGAFATQYAMQQPLQRLQFAEGRANVLTQNLQQRMGLEQNIFNQGMSAQQADFQQRFSKYQGELGKQTTLAQGKFEQDKAETTPIQRFGQAMTGIVGSFGAGMSAMSSLGGMGGGGGGGGGVGGTPWSLGTGYLNAKNPSGNIFGVGTG
jgi:hypothetical protein